MPRGGSRTSSPSRSTATRVQPAPARPVQTPVQAAPQQSGGMMSGLMGTMVSGMAFGAGSEVAHQAVRSMMGSGSQQHQAAPQEQVQQQQKCVNEGNAFSQCLQRNNDLVQCQPYMDVLKECQKQI